MTVDDFLGRLRYPLLRLVAITLAASGIAGATFGVVHGWYGKAQVFAPPPAPSVDFIQTGSVSSGDAIGEMIEGLETKATGQHP
jgi:hypothetical protein